MNNVGIESVARIMKIVSQLNNVQGVHSNCVANYFVMSLFRRL